MKKEKKAPLVCIVILNWNGGEITLDCLKTLRKTKYPYYKTIVVDNGSTDGSDKIIVEKFKEVELIQSGKNLGYTGGMNFGWNYCLKKYNPDYICNMNNDIKTVQPNWLDLMVEELGKKSRRGICGNKLVFPDGRLQQLYWDRHPKEYNEQDRGQYDYIKEVTAVGGANMLIKREVIKKIGGNDENYFYGPDDIDYNLRAKKAGFISVYCGKSKSVHIGSFSYNSSKKDFIYKHQSYGQMIFSFRHETTIKKLNMILTQFARVFVTRKNPFLKKDLSNLYLHKSVLKRGIYFFNSLFSAAINYNKVKIGDYPILKDEKTTI
jgi:GT2 family glycosyltransferase